MRWVPESLADVWAESRDLEEQPFEDVGLFVLIFRPEFIFRVVMFDEIKENGARFPNNKIVAFVINNCRNPSIGIDFRVFFMSAPTNCGGVPAPLCSPAMKFKK